MTKLKSKANASKEYINSMFNNIAKKYDLLNNLMTFGFHNKWKEETIKLSLMEIKDPRNALDLCSGTADIAIILNKYSPNTEIICMDNSQNMLEIANQKIKKYNIKNIELIVGDSENLSFIPNAFNLITIGFGLRNLINRDVFISNIYNLLDKNGVFACIDLGHPKNSFWKEIYYFYFYKIIPLLGYVFAKNKEAYTYLPESLKTWYEQEEFKDKLLSKGFKKCFYKDILGGVIAIHLAVK